MRLRILIRLKPEVLDVQGKAVENGLKEFGVQGSSNVRIGKLIELEVEQGNEHETRVQIEKACQKFLANPIIETFEIQTIQ